MFDWYEALDQIMCWSEILPLLTIVFFYFRSKKTPPFRWIFLAATAFLGGMYEFSSSLLPENVSLYWYYIFTLLETLGIVIFFSQYTHRVWRWGIYIVFSVITILLFTTTSIEANYYHFGWVCLMQLALTLYGVFAWGKYRFQNITYPTLFHDPDYFVIIGLVFYLSACTLYYILYPQMIQFPNDNALFYWIILPLSIMIYGFSLLIGTIRILKNQ